MHAKADRRIRRVGNRVDAVDVEPLAGDGKSDIGLVLVIGGEHFRRLAEHRAGIFHRHADRFDGLLAAVDRVDGVLIVQDADPYRRVGGAGRTGNESYAADAAP